MCMLLCFMLQVTTLAWTAHDGNGKVNAYIVWFRAGALAPESHHTYVGLFLFPPWRYQAPDS